MDPNFADAQVSLLINPYIKYWDLTILNNLLWPRDIEVIQSILLCQYHVEDKYFWPFAQSIVYTVKSGYKFLTQELGGFELNHRARDQELWRKV